MLMHSIYKTEMGLLLITINGTLLCLAESTYAGKQSNIMEDSSWGTTD
jgi:hypothetical protein